MLEKIVFATDFSEASRQTLGYAAAIARRTGAKLIGAHALKPPSSLFAQKVEELKRWEEEHQSKLDDFMNAAVLADVEVEDRLCPGSPESALAELASKESADLILVAKRSRSTLEKLFVGSFTERIVAEAPLPVLVIPDTDHYSAAWNPVLCPIDFSRRSTNALEWAINLVQQFKAELTVVHVLPEGAAESETALAGERLRNAASVLNAPQGTRFLTLNGKPGETIVGEAERMGCDLVVMGRRGQSQGDFIGMGSTARNVLRMETFPLVIVPDTQ